MLSGSIIPLMQLFESCLFLGMLIFLVAKLIQGLLVNPIAWRHIHPSDKTLMQLHGPSSSPSVHGCRSVVVDMSDLTYCLAAIGGHTGYTEIGS